MLLCFAHSFQACNSIATALSKLCCPPTTHPTLEREDSSPQQEVFLAAALDFWDSILSDPLPHILQEDSHPQLKAACCDCLSSIGPSVLSALPVCIAILFLYCFLCSSCITNHLYMLLYFYTHSQIIRSCVLQCCSASHPISTLWFRSQRYMLLVFMCCFLVSDVMSALSLMLPIL